MKVVWTEQALTRLLEIEEYVAAHNPAAAVKLVDKLVSLGDSLRRFPSRGRPLPELPRSRLRELVFRNYRIVYRKRGKTTQILTVFEGHRLLPSEDL